MWCLKLRTWIESCPITLNSLKRYYLSNCGCVALSKWIQYNWTLELIFIGLSKIEKKKKKITQHFLQPFFPGYLSLVFPPILAIYKSKVCQVGLGARFFFVTINSVEGEEKDVGLGMGPVSMLTLFLLWFINHRPTWWGPPPSPLPSICSIKSWFIITLFF